MAFLGLLAAALAAGLAAGFAAAFPGATFFVSTFFAVAVFVAFFVFPGILKLHKMNHSLDQSFDFLYCSKVSSFLKLDLIF
jgi:hypothetical protein